MGIDIGAARARRIVGLHNGGQLRTIRFQRHLVERICTLCAGLAVAVFQVMDMDAEDALAIVPRLHDFMIDPLSIGSPRTDQHHQAAAAIHLVSNPFFDCLVTALGDSLPVVIFGGLVTLDCSDVTNLRGTPVVGGIVEAIKNPSCHIDLQVVGR